MRPWSGRNVSVSLPERVPHGISAGRPHPGQSAADDPLVETCRPTGSASFFQVDECGVDGAFYRRVPTESNIASVALPDAHAAGGEDVEFEDAVRDREEVNALRESSPQGLLADGPRAEGFFQMVDPEVL